MVEFFGVKLVLGGANEPFKSDIGALLPVALCGRPSLYSLRRYFLPGIVKAQEPVRVQAFASELAVQGFDGAVVRRLARP